MATPSAVFSEMVTTTWQNQRKNVMDAVSKHTVLYNLLQKKGNKIMVPGGNTIVQPIEYAENGTYQRYSGYDTLNINPSEVFTSVEYPWKSIAMHITASGEELRKNSGKHQIVNLAKSRMKNAITSFRNNFSSDLYSDGTLPKQISGLQALIADSGTGTVGGIDSGAWPFWANFVQTNTAPIQGGSAVTLSASTIYSQMRALYMRMTRNGESPDRIIADFNYFSMFEDSLLDRKRYTGESAEAGFMSLKFHGAEVVYDGNSGIPANHMYFLISDYLQLCVHPDADLTEVGGMRPLQQDASVTPILWMGNLITTNRGRLGVFWQGA